MSSRVEAQIDQLLKQHGAVLVRDHKHLVYRLPTNKTFVVAKNSGDPRAVKNNLSDLKRMLCVPHEPAAPRVRRHHKKRRLPTTPIIFNDAVPAPVPTFRTQLYQAYYGPDMLVIQPQEFHAELNYTLRAARSTEPPPEPDHTPRPHRERRPRTEPLQKPANVHILPPDILKQANEILKHDGEAAMRDFLNHHRSDFLEVAPSTARALSRASIEETTVEIPISRIDAAKAKKLELERQMAECDDTIRNRQQIKVLAEANLNEINEYISCHEMLTQQEAKIAELLPSASALASQGMQLVDKGNKRDLITPIMSVFRNQPTGQLTAALVHAGIKKQFPDFNCTPAEVSQRLTYLAKSKQLDRVGVGVYALRVVSNSSTKAATA